MFNNIFNIETIPAKWLEGRITPLYKGKGAKADLQNFRGISVNSNIEKAFERVLNNRIQKTLQFTEAQAGGRPGKSTNDQLLVLKAVMKQAHEDNRPLYIAFLDVQKAYDKAWLDAILHTLWQSGIKGRIWRMIRRLNTDLQAQVQTKYGLTRVIHMKDNIRQGGVLSVTEYSKMIDEMCEVLTNGNIGAKYGHLSIPTLLLMDDITLLADTPTQLQRMLDITFQQARKYHVCFGANKCKVMTVNPDKNRNLGWMLVISIPGRNYFTRLLPEDSYRNQEERG